MADNKDPKNKPGKSRISTIISWAIGPILFLVPFLLNLEGLSFEGTVVLATLLWVVSRRYPKKM